MQPKIPFPSTFRNIITGFGFKSYLTFEKKFHVTFKSLKFHKSDPLPREPKKMFVELNIADFIAKNKNAFQ